MGAVGLLGCQPALRAAGVCSISGSVLMLCPGPCLSPALHSLAGTFPLPPPGVQQPSLGQNCWRL